MLDRSERQFRRWEAGDQEMPAAAWRPLRLTCGYPYPLDFTTTVELDVEPTCGWNATRDQNRGTIERGDTVYLQPIEEPTGASTASIEYN